MLNTPNLSWVSKTLVAEYLSVSQGSRKCVREFSFIVGTRDGSKTKPLGHISRATLNSSASSWKACWGNEKAQVTSQAARSVIFKVHFSSLSFSVLKKKTAELSPQTKIYIKHKSGAAMVEVWEKNSKPPQPASPAPW